MLQRRWRRRAICFGSSWITVRESCALAWAGTWRLRRLTWTRPLAVAGRAQADRPGHVRPWPPLLSGGGHL
eukprot:scaffold63404_cov35-Tisochrysis_lutea.AAC.5